MSYDETDFTDVLISTPDYDEAVRYARFKHCVSAEHEALDEQHYGVVCVKDLAHHSETEYEVLKLEDCPDTGVAPPHRIWDTT
jgi:hypothetical protein